MLKFFLLMILGVIVLTVLGIVSSRPSLSDFNVDKGISEADLIPSGMSSGRRFDMGFTHQVWDWSSEAFADTARLIHRYGDLVTLWHDTGVPWEVSSSGAPFPTGLEEELSRQQELAATMKTVVIMTSFLGADRNQLSDSITEKGAVPRDGSWANRDIGDAEVTDAYLRFCKRLINRFEPAAFGYVAEVDTIFTDPAAPRFERVLRMSRDVYHALKTTYPNLTVFAEFNLGDESYMEARRTVIDALLPYSDLYGLSAYPARLDSVAGDAKKLEAGYFDRAVEFAGGKPIAIVETGFHAEPFMHPTLGIAVRDKHDKLLIPGGPRSQALYTKILLEAAERLDMRWVNLWNVRDLDPLFDKLAAAGGPLADPMWRLVQDAGLIDETGRPRPSLRVWEHWLGQPRLKPDSKQQNK